MGLFIPPYVVCVISMALFDEILWIDPLSGRELKPIVSARTPAGVPVCGALQISGTNQGYPIVDCVARLTPELANRYKEWLQPFGLSAPACNIGTTDSFQLVESVESFGFQWSWNPQMRSEKDLEWRVARRFNFSPSDFKGAIVLDAGAGAGDQSAYLLQQGAKVLSIDLSSAIHVVAGKLRANPNWFGIQGDITALPLADNSFDYVYCEGVIQHTRDSAGTVSELARVIKPLGQILATHYDLPNSFAGQLRLKWQSLLRKYFAKIERYQLLLLSGNLAALSYLPLLGWLLRKSGSVLYYDLMTDFKSTWTNTYDYYGGHSYQRYFTSEQFRSCFEQAGQFEFEFCEGTIVRARKIRINEKLQASVA